MPIELQYKKYLELRTQIADLEEKLKLVSDFIKQDILNNDGQIVDTPQGSFYITRRKKYEYSPAVNVLEVTLKETKKEEEQTGLATVLDETVSLTFRGKKV